mmetsp:Transcript_5614/g.13072  ORF Transcript_5614/g.13072 Transcript_5614/m.13072 type:complete len:117 (-) Transcript_5614:2858-3208(-)
MRPSSFHVAGTSFSYRAVMSSVISGENAVTLFRLIVCTRREREAFTFDTNLCRRSISCERKILSGEGPPNFFEFVDDILPHKVTWHLLLSMADCLHEEREGSFHLRYQPLQAVNFL